MKRHLKVITPIIIFMVISIISGCSQEIKKPSKLKNEIIVDAYNINIKYDINSFSRNLDFEIISPEKYDGEINIEFDTTIPYSFYVNEINNNEEDGMLWHTEFAYAECDFDKLSKLYLDFTKDSEKNVVTTHDYLEYRLKYNDLGGKITKDLQTLYKYEVVVLFDFPNECYEEISTMKIVFNEKEYKYEIGKIKIDMNQSELFEWSDHINLKYIGFSNRGITPNSEGIIFSENLIFEVQSPITIIGFEIENEGANIINTEIVISDENGSINKEVSEGETFDLLENSDVKLNFVIEDHNFKNEIYYNTIYRYIIYYENDGEKFMVNFEDGVRTRLNKYEHIAIQKDNIDIMSYYNDYLFKIEGAK